MATGRTVNKLLPPTRRRPFSLSWDALAPDENLRDTGIPPLGCIPWGSHICVFVDTPQDLIEAVRPYFRSGITHNECCIWSVTPPLTEADAWEALRKEFPDLDELRAKGAIEIVAGTEMYFRNEKIDGERILALWLERIHRATERGFAGVRASANSLWQRLDLWDDFQDYERMVERVLDGQRMILLCTYSMETSKAADVLNVACSHQCIIARRHNNWKFLEVPGNDNAIKELARLNGEAELLDARPEIEKSLTQRERIILGQLLKGQSSKEIGRALGISHRTVDFHRANLLTKLNAKNTAELIRRVLHP